MAAPTKYVEVAFTTAPSSTTPAWEDVTTYVQHEAGIGIERGRSEELSDVQPSQCKILLENSDGRFTPAKTDGAYYPNVKKGRRIRALATTFPNTSFETDTTGWSGTQATLARVTTPVRSGSGALQLTATAASPYSADTPTGTSGQPVVAGAAYVLCGWFRTAVTSRSCSMRVDWYTDAGALISGESTATVASSTSAYTAAEARVVAPATAAYAAIRAIIGNGAIGELHYVDFAMLATARFSGYVDDWSVTWPGVVPSFATCAVSASSRMAKLGRGSELRSIVEEEILLDEPVAHYPLSEASGAVSAADVTGDSNGTLTRRTIGAGGGTLAFGSEGGPETDTLTALSVTNSAGAGRYLRGPLEGFTDPRNFTLAVFHSTSASNDSGIMCAVMQDGFVEAVGGNNDGFIVLSTTGANPDLTGGWSLSDALAGSITIFQDVVEGVSDGELHHCALTGDGTTLRMFYDGAVQTDTDPIPAGTWTPATLSIAGVDYGATVGEGVFAHVVLFDSKLDDARIAAHAEAGLTGFAGETCAERLTRYATYARIPASETSFETGELPDLAHIDTTGKTALACMREVEQAEGGVLFDAADGVLTFHARSHRYAQASAFTVPAAKVVTPLAPVLDDQFLVNDMTATGSAGVVARVTDAGSIEDYDAYKQTMELATSNADEPFQAASWRVGRYADPSVRVPSIEVHLNKADANLTAAMLGAEIGTRFTVTGLSAANAPATSMDLIVEGVSERIDAMEHRITLRTSPAELFDVWILEDATYGVLDSTTRLAY